MIGCSAAIKRIAQKLGIGLIPHHRPERDTGLAGEVNMKIRTPADRRRKARRAAVKWGALLPRPAEMLGLGAQSLGGVPFTVSPARGWRDCKSVDFQGGGFILLPGEAVTVEGGRLHRLNVVERFQDELRADSAARELLDSLLESWRKPSERAILASRLYIWQGGSLANVRLWEAATLRLSPEMRVSLQFQLAEL